jgi:hypothetical protein
MAELHRSGHPRNAVWFCRDHAAVALEHEDLDRDEGLAAILQQVRAGTGPEAGTP